MIEVRPDGCRWTMFGYTTLSEIGLEGNKNG